LTDRRPDCVFGVLVREGKVFLRLDEGRLALPGGEFRPLAEDRKAELRAYLLEQLGVSARSIWAQGAFAYTPPGEDEERFCGFYSIWEWQGEPREDAGRWVDKEQVAWAPGLPPSLRILLLSVLDTVALRTR
jgi:hypothetical protein